MISAYLRAGANPFAVAFFAVLGAVINFAAARRFTLEDLLEALD